MEAKTILVPMPTIHANKHEKGATDIIFFHPNKRNWYFGNYEKDWEKYLRVLTGDAKNKMLVQVGPILCM